MRKIEILGVVRRDASGTAAIEFALTGLMLVLGLMNAVDVGFYAYRVMEVENSAEAGAQAGWKTCGPPRGPPQTPVWPATLPATQKCPGLNSAITTAIQATSLGTAVSLASGYPAEDYRCANASNVLQFVGPVSSSKPANCAAAGNAATSPGDYIQVQATYAYTPLFSGLTVMKLLGISTITKTTWMRMG